MMHTRNHLLVLSRLCASVVLVSILAIGLVGCTPGGGTPDALGDGGTDGGGTDGTTDGTTDGNALLNDSLGYGGSLSGKVSDTQSTRASVSDTSAAQSLPEDFDTGSTVVRFLDVLGNALLGAVGQPLPTVPLNPDGTFSAENLPVGVDFTICVDVGNDGTCDLQSSANIPSASGGGEGELAGADVDPLTTVVLAKLLQLIEDKGLDPVRLPISPAALVTRIVQAYTHLFEDAGVEHEVDLGDIETLAEEELATFFDASIPSIARIGMDLAQGNIDLAKAGDIDAAALAAAEVFLRAGFPIADAPGGLDFSSLARLDGVEAATIQALFGDGGDPFTEDFADVDEDLPVEPAQFPGGDFGPTVYYSTLTEPDRNFSEDEAQGEGAGKPHLPVLHDYLLMEMARLQLEGRHITIGALHDLLTSIESGLGARLTYFIFNPGAFGPPLNMFQTEDGQGKAIDLQTFFSRVFNAGFQGLDAEAIQEREKDLRNLLAELLAGTTPPALEQLAGSFFTERVVGIDTLTAIIRESRAHLPFSRTGPSSFFVIADGDPFRSENVDAVTVDAEVTPDGDVTAVTFNPGGTGKYVLQFTESTNGSGIVALMVRETGRQVHGRRGPVRLDLRDGSIFAPVNGEAFFDFVSEAGDFFPAVPIVVVASNFVPEPPPSDPNAQVGPIDSELDTDPTTPTPVEGPLDESPDAETPTEEPTVAPAEFESSGPNQQILVLATHDGPGAEPVRVDYDFAAGTAVYNPAGQHVLHFIPGTNETGLFLLFNEQTGRPASRNDPADFFFAPPPDGTAMPPPPEPTTVPAWVRPRQVDGVTDPTTTGEGTEPIIVPGYDPSLIIISIDQVAGLPVGRQHYTHIFGTDEPNARYNADGDPYFDDINGNGVQDADEPTSPHRPTLFNPEDWRSTDVRLYYRRSDNNAAVTFEEMNFAAEAPQTMDGVALVPRNFLPRLNAYRFGRPNTALNLLTAFTPPEFFDGTHGINAETELDIFAATAVLNLMMDQVLNLEAEIDIDGAGPLPSQHVVVDAHLFVAPIGDPFVLLIKGFSEQSFVPEADDDEADDAASADDSDAASADDADAATDEADDASTSDTDDATTEDADASTDDSVPSVVGG
ncbi:MAG: hypothetical protein HY763_03695 [Planctomycetes bacterium]|nr:hypothetical protein [Planctomycetota bacterium]